MQTYDPIAVFMTGSIRTGSSSLTRKPRALTSWGRDVLQVDSKVTKATKGKAPSNNAQSPLSKSRNRPPVVRYPNMSSSHRGSLSRVAFLASRRDRGCSALTTMGGKPRFQHEPEKKSRGGSARLEIESAIRPAALACSPVGVAIAHQSVSWTSKLSTDAGPALQDDTL